MAIDIFVLLHKVICVVVWPSKMITCIRIFVVFDSPFRNKLPIIFKNDASSLAFLYLYSVSTWKTFCSILVSFYQRLWWVLMKRRYTNISDYINIAILLHKLLFQSMLSWLLLAYLSVPVPLMSYLKLSINCCSAACYDLLNNNATFRRRLSIYPVYLLLCNLLEQTALDKLLRTAAGHSYDT